jgi:hypothetical protein
MASQNPEDPMTKNRSKSKPTARKHARKSIKLKLHRRSLPVPRAAATRSDTKRARIIAMLRMPAGATIAAMMTATDWQQHSVRGFLAGVVREPEHSEVAGAHDALSLPAMHQSRAFPRQTD